MMEGQELLMNIHDNMGFIENELEEANKILTGLKDKADIDHMKGFVHTLKQKYRNLKAEEKRFYRDHPGDEYS